MFWQQGGNEDPGLLNKTHHASSTASAIQDSQQLSVYVAEVPNRYTDKSRVELQYGLASLGPHLSIEHEL